LQQNAFDDVDAATPIERQIRDLKLIHRAMNTRFEFESKPEARAFFSKLQDAFYQKNYCKLDSKEFADYEETIREMLMTGVQA